MVAATLGHACDRAQLPRGPGAGVVILHTVSGSHVGRADHTKIASKAKWRAFKVDAFRLALVEAMRRCKSGEIPMAPLRS